MAVTNDMTLTLALNILKALGGDTSVEYTSADDVWNDINAIYDEKKITFDVAQINLDVAENGVYEFQATDEIDAYVPVKINVDVQSKGGGVDFASLGYNEDEILLCNQMINNDITLAQQIINDVNAGVFSGGFGTYKDIVFAPKLDNYTFEWGLSGVFANCEKLRYVPNYNINWVAQWSSGAADSAFENCRSLKEIPTTIDLSPAESCSSMFKNCVGLTTVNLNIAKPVNCYSMFEGCTGLGNVYSIGTDMTNVTAMTNMFKGCQMLQTCCDFNTSSVLMDVSSMFENCGVQNAPAIDTSGVMSFNYMFKHSALMGDASYNTTSATDMASMFEGCWGLTGVNFVGGTGNATNMRDLFNGCSMLKTITGLDTSSCVDADGLFTGCTSLTSLPALNCGQMTGFDNHGLFDNDSSWTTYWSLTDVGGFINIGEQFGVGEFNLSKLPVLSADSINNIINNLYDRASTGWYPTATLVFNTALEQLVSVDALVAAIGKGWNIEYRG